MTSPAVLVGVGGVLGAIARHLVGARIETDNADTFAVNVLGSVALGLLVTVPLDAQLAFVFATGFCGAFTTFSSFAFETVRLYETGHRRRAVTNAAGSLAAALVGVALGAGLGSVLAGAM
ncbi:fluoride efflux transporter FluC [Halapricum hydrolyticum]|uniref:Fluoride-specific ion channel FluC n=1 Tax=Halapricum hydrolyticum TaxID=2979991 RepID=A0AAE3I9D7_9EURY|nr:CrcB family protein [Halapricum hydrolyticum]MCU4717323.1 CrcB family protein [Halapricum hydrolyticum]MCU4726250.1 CrcB family protein [Halapricum hydrolyticum]